MKKTFDGVTLTVTAPSRQWVTPTGEIDWALRRRAFAAAEALGFNVKEMFGTTLETARFAGDDATRAADFMTAMTEIDTDIVMAMRGGYGAGRLLKLLDWDRLAKSDRPFVGFSDVTALNLALLAKSGRESWQGPSLRDLIDPDPLTVEGLRQVAGLSPFEVRWRTSDEQIEFDEEGVLWGGNLSLMTSSWGTEYFPEIEGGILFIEEVREPAYHIERMMMPFLNSGLIARQKALVIGSLDGVDRATAWEGDFSCVQMMDFIRERAGVPVITGLPFGHIHAKCSLPVGRKVSLTVRGADVQLKDAY